MAMSSPFHTPLIKREVQSRILLSDQPGESAIDASSCNSASNVGAVRSVSLGIAQIPTRISAPPLDRSLLHGVLASIPQLLRRPAAHWQRRQT